MVQNNIVIPLPQPQIPHIYHDGSTQKEDKLRTIPKEQYTSSGYTQNSLTCIPPTQKTYIEMQEMLMKDYARQSNESQLNTIPLQRGINILPLKSIINEYPLELQSDEINKIEYTHTVEVCDEWYNQLQKVWDTTQIRKQHGLRSVFQKQICNTTTTNDFESYINLFIETASPYIFISPKTIDSSELQEKYAVLDSTELVLYDTLYAIRFIDHKQRYTIDNNEEYDEQEQQLPFMSPRRLKRRICEWQKFDIMSCDKKEKPEFVLYEGGDFLIGDISEIVSANYKYRINNKDKISKILHLNNDLFFKEKYLNNTNNIKQWQTLSGEYLGGISHVLLEQRNIRKIFINDHKKYIKTISLINIQNNTIETSIGKTKSLVCTLDISKPYSTNNIDDIDTIITTLKGPYSIDLLRQQDLPGFESQCLLYPDYKSMCNRRFNSNGFVPSISMEFFLGARKVIGQTDLDTIISISRSGYKSWNCQNKDNYNFNIDLFSHVRPDYILLSDKILEFYNNTDTIIDKNIYNISRCLDQFLSNDNETEIIYHDEIEKNIYLNIPLWLETATCSLQNTVQLTLQSLRQGGSCMFVFEECFSPFSISLLGILQRLFSRVIIHIPYFISMVGSTQRIVSCIQLQQSRPFTIIYPLGRLLAHVWESSTNQIGLFNTSIKNCNIKKSVSLIGTWLIEPKELLKSNTIFDQLNTINLYIIRCQIYILETMYTRYTQMYTKNMLKQSFNQFSNLLMYDENQWLQIIDEYNKEDSTRWSQQHEFILEKLLNLSNIVKCVNCYTQKQYPLVSWFLDDKRCDDGGSAAATTNKATYIVEFYMNKWGISQRKL